MQSSSSSALQSSLKGGSLGRGGTKTRKGGRPGEEGGLGKRARGDRDRVATAAGPSKPCSKGLALAAVQRRKAAVTTPPSRYSSCGRARVQRLAQKAAQARPDDEARTSTQLGNNSRAREREREKEEEEEEGLGGLPERGRHVNAEEARNRSGDRHVTSKRA